MAEKTKAAKKPVSTKAPMQKAYNSLGKGRMYNGSGNG